MFKSHVWIDLHFFQFMFMVLILLVPTGVQTFSDSVSFLHLEQFEKTLINE